MVDNDMPGVWPVWTPGAPLAAFIKKSIIHWSTQHRKKLWAIWFRRRFFKVFPMTPVWDPRGTVCRIYKEDQ